MPYRLSDFGTISAPNPPILNHFKSNGDGIGVIEPGEVITKLPADVRAVLKSLSNKDAGDDPSKDDFRALCLLIEKGHTPQDALATLIHSPRGKHAAERHRNFDDYAQRTLSKAVAHVGRAESFGISHVISGGKEILIDEITEADDWRTHFRTRSQLNQSPLSFVIDRLVPEEGITGIGGLSGHGKTFLMMSMAKAISRGGILWKRFKTCKRPVLYLIPESGDRSFHHRMKLLRIPDSEQFLVRTMSQGSTLSLSSETMLRAVGGRVVFLDTLPRFTEGKDEQQAHDMAELGEILLGLIRAGAVAVIFAHHSPKTSRKEDEMDLENCFRGSGDIGAIMSAGHGVRSIDANRTLVQVECVKPRDFEPWGPLQLEGRPWIDEEGDFRMVKEPGQCSTVAGEKRKRSDGELAARVLKVIKKTPGLSGNKICQQVAGNRNRIYEVLETQNEKEWKLEKDGYYAVD